jgi:hypothetical protein
MLQFQNHKLAQQLDHQRSEISALESRCSQFRSKQASYDDTLITVNRAWNTVSVLPSIQSKLENLLRFRICSSAFSVHNDWERVIKNKAILTLKLWHSAFLCFQHAKELSVT